MHCRSMLTGKETDMGKQVTCFNCMKDTVVWDSDFSYEDMGYEGEGIVHMCHCTNCGADIEYRIPIKEEE